MDRKISAGLQEYIGMVLNHDFSCLSSGSDYLPRISEKYGEGLVHSVKMLAEEYRDSLTRAEEIVKELAAVEEKNEELIARQDIILNNSLVGIVLVQKRKIVKANHKMAEMFGYRSPEDLIGGNTRFVYRSDEDYTEIGEIIYSDLKRKQEAKIEFRARRKDGSEFWCLLAGKAVSLENESGEIDSVWILQDIEDEKKAMETAIALEEDNEKLIKRQLSILNNSVVGIVLLSKRKILQANNKMAEMFGYDSPQELIGKYTRAFYRSDKDYEEIGKRCYPVIFGGGEYREELIGKRKDGSEFWCQLTGKAVSLDDGEGADSVWIYQDIDEIKKQEENLRRSRGLYSAIISNMADGLFVIDVNKKIISFNYSFSSMFELAADSLSGKRIYEIFEEDVTGLIDKVFAGLPAAQRNNEFFSDEITLKNGRTGKAVATPMFVQSLAGHEGTADGQAADGDAVFSGAVVSIRDITKEKEIDTMKTDFISTVSHELRTPLTSIIGFANIIRKKFNESLLAVLDLEDKKTRKVADQIGSNLDIIIGEGRRLTSLINDVLDIAKMEAGKIDWKDESFAIKSAIDHSVTSTVSLFEQKGLNMALDIEENLPEILGDKDRYIQVLINLISNAVKFTNNGTITCGAGISGDGILVRVADQGIGISRENLDKVFDKFKQVGDTLTDKPQGTGLGLPICKQIVEHYGGKIWVESEPGKGSTFYFTIPAARGARPDANNSGINKIDIESFIEKFNGVSRTGRETNADSKSILIVDDDHAIREFLKQELENAGYSTDEAADGMEALNKIKQKKYNLIILDVMMPGLSGFDLSAVLKSDPYTMDIPIMILSILEDRKRGYQAGADKYLVKGIDAEKLLNEVKELIARGASRRKVIVIDEDKSIFNLLTEVMRSEGYTVMNISPHSGNDYMEKIKRERPDIIIIDELVPGKENIIEAIKAIDEAGAVATFIIIGRDAGNRKDYKDDKIQELFK
jgi:PAS domain S-box-containing protein